MFCSRRILRPVSIFLKKWQLTNLTIKHVIPKLPRPRPPTAEFIWNLFEGGFFFTPEAIMECTCISIYYIIDSVIKYLLTDNEKFNAFSLCVRIVFVCVCVFTNPNDDRLLYTFAFKNSIQSITVFVVLLCFEYWSNRRWR